MDKNWIDLIQDYKSSGLTAAKWCEEKGCYPGSKQKEFILNHQKKEGDVWIDMLDDRILTSHTYDESEARNIYSKIKTKYVVAFDDLRESIAGVIEG